MCRSVDFLFDNAPGNLNGQSGNGVLHFLNAFFFLSDNFFLRTRDDGGSFGVGFVHNIFANLFAELPGFFNHFAGFHAGFGDLFLVIVHQLLRFSARLLRFVELSFDCLAATVESFGDGLKGKLREQDQQHYKCDECPNLQAVVCRYDAAFFRARHDWQRRKTEAESESESGLHGRVT